MGTFLEFRGGTSLPIEATGLSPESLAGLGAAEVARLRLPVGNATEEIGDLFRVSVFPEDESLRLAGDLSHFRGVGRGLTRGTIRIEGNVGPFAGEGMTGGLIEVLGDAGDWAGAEMAGGRLRIEGNAGRCLGAARPGSRRGMREGTITVGGSAGEEAGHKMRRGLIAVQGPLGPFAGRAMIAGSLFAFSGIGPYAGTGMKRGSIVVVGTDDPTLLPTFRDAGPYRFPFLALYFRELERIGVSVPDWVYLKAFRRYNGDLAERGRGEVLAASSGSQG